MGQPTSDRWKINFVDFGAHGARLLAGRLRWRAALAATAVRPCGASLRGVPFLLGWLTSGIDGVGFQRSLERYLTLNT